MVYPYKVKVKGVWYASGVDIPDVAPTKTEEKKVEFISPTIEETPKTDYSLAELREMGKAKKIKSYHLLSEEKLRNALGI